MHSEVSVQSIVVGTDPDEQCLEMEITEANNNPNYFQIFVESRKT